MSLLEIKNKLYSKKYDENLPKSGGSRFDIGAGGMNINSDEKRPVDGWEAKKEIIGLEQKKALKLGIWIIGGIIILVLATFGIFKYMQSAFSEEKVIVSISGVQDAPSGELLAYEISYSNNNRAALKDAVLRATYPESFKPLENENFKVEGRTSGIFTIGEIAGKSNGKIVLNGNAYSAKGTLVYIKSDLIYKPSGSNSQFVAKNQLAVNINSSPVSLEIMAPQELVSGDAMDYEIKYINNGKEDFNNIKIKADYPEGFTFSKADPRNSEGNNTWHIGKILAGQSGKIVVSGKLEGNRDEVKNIIAYIGISENEQFINYNEGKSSTAIIASPVIIEQTVNGVKETNIKAGDILKFVIRYKNDSAAGLRDVIITDKIDSPILDYSSLDLRQGAFDQNNKIITWKGADNSNLRFLGPGQTGEITFNIRVKPVVSAENANDKNFTLSSIVKIDSPDIKSSLQENKIIAGNSLNMKLETKLSLDVKGYFNDSVISNSGPIPPQVGKATTYTIHWKIANAFNDVSNAQVSAVLPAGATMTGNIMPNDGRLAYNSRNNSAVWEIGNLAAGAGILTPPKEVSFQIQITPAQNQLDSVVDLVGPAIFSAKDLFTNSDVFFIAGKKDTELREDSGIGSNYKVVQ